ncbi:MAG: bis-aminopropyl spermidine synthase family protein [Myxococcota bacterium]
MADPPLYHLGDGIVLGIGSRSSVLIDLQKDHEIEIDFRYIEPLENVSLGSTLDDYEAFAPRLLREGILAHGEAGVDPVIRDRLAILDRMFMTAYACNLDERARHAYELTLSAHARRKRFFTRVGQCPTLPETTLRRALLVGDARKVGVKNVLCLGDDDLISIPLAVLGHRVTVYDIDDFLLAFLRGVCTELELDVMVEERDLRDPLKSDEKETFDLFLTDPMSNRDCFEIFLSRAFTMVKPGGKGFVAVYGPTGRLFRQVASEMKFPINRWYARHNRYYSQYIKLHTYESDWLEVEKSADTIIKHPADEFCVPINLYAEAFYQRKPTFLSFYDQIEDCHYAKPYYLDMVIDLVEQVTSLKITDRTVHPGDGWAVVHGRTDEGYLTLHVDRERQQLSLELFPMRIDIEDPLRHMLMAAYKTEVNSAKMSSDRDVWDLRIR